jgi:hypothetical protein
MITIIMPSYNRDVFLLDSEHPTLRIANNDTIDRLIIVWQNVDREPSSELLKHIESIGNKKIVLVCPKVNSLNNRFMNFEEIKTDCIVSIDDDYTCTKESIVEMYKFWSSSTDSLVGCVPRLIDPSKRLYTGDAAHYKSNIPYNFLLTGYAMFHRKYLDLYNENTNAKSLVDKQMNAEDIYFNYMHFRHSSAPRFYVHHDDKVKTWRRISNNGISTMDPGHLDKRFHMCKFLESLGYQRPPATHFRFDIL